MPTVRELVISVRAKAETRALDDADRRIDKVKGGAGQLGGELRKLAGAFVGLQAARKAFSAFEEATGAAAKFGKGIAQIGSLIPNSQARLDELREGVMALAAETGAPLNDLTDGVYNVVSAIGDTGDVLEITRQSAVAATAGLTNMGTATELLTNVSLAYGGATKENTKRVSDLAFMAVNLGSKLRFEELAASANGAIPLAAKLGVTMEEYFSIIATAAGPTGNASEVVTQISSAMVSLTKRTPEGEKALKKMGFSSAQAAVEQLGLVGTMRGMAAQMDGTAESMLKLFHRQEGATLAMALSGAQAQSFDDKLVALTRSAGATDVAFREATTGAGQLAQDMAKQKVEAEKLEIALGDKVSPAVMAVNKGFLGLKQAGADALIDNVEVFANLATAIGGAGTDMEAFKTTAEAVAWSVKEAAGLMALGFLDVKIVVQELLGDLMAVAAATSGDQAGARAIMEQKRKDTASTSAAISEVEAELLRSPEESRRVRERRKTDKVRAALGFEPGQGGNPLSRDDLGNGVSRRNFPGGASDLSYGAGPYRANLGGAEGAAARAEIKQLTINVPPGTSIEQAKAIVREGVGGGLHDAVVASQQLIPGFRGKGGQNLE